MKTKVIGAVYYISGLAFLIGAINFFYPFQESISPPLLMGLGIILPLIVDYNRVVSRGFIEMWLNFFILASAFLLLIKPAMGILVFILFKSLLYAKQGGLILKNR